MSRRRRVPLRLGAGDKQKRSLQPAERRPIALAGDKLICEKFYADGVAFVPAFDAFVFAGFAGASDGEVEGFGQVGDVFAFELCAVYGEVGDLAPDLFEHAKFDHARSDARCAAFFASWRNIGCHWIAPEINRL